jgi:hypothetical protein
MQEASSNIKRKGSSTHDERGLIMKRTQAIVATLVCSLMLPTSFALAAGQSDDAQEKVEKQQQEQIYGSQMMSEQERHEYRARMHAAKTQQEREQIRLEHHERMQERAKAMGMSLPDTPPPTGGGMGQGMGHGMGGGKGKSK